MKYLKGRGKIFFLIILTVSMFAACGGNGGNGGSETPSDAKAITAFSFTASATIDEGAKTIMATVPYGTDVTGLIATFTTTGQSVKVGVTAQTSGTTANDFTNPVTYTVTAADSSTADYTITVTVGGAAAGDKVTYSAGSVSFNMVYLPGGITFLTGTNDSGSATVTDAYLIGETEVTYELWYAVRDWAVNTASPAYAFANDGREGNNGTIGDAPTADDQEPVTTINWRDAMVWMNALTEYYNAQNGTSLAPVYTYSAAIIRDSQDSNAAVCDGAVASPTANGFRLLSSDEYELAARYIDDANSDSDIQDAGEYYPGNYASGATADYNNAGATGFVAVYSVNSGNVTAVVKSKNANALGLYDMSGNVWEWVFDLSGSTRVNRGGSYNYSASYMQVGFWRNNNPYFEDIIIGFRFARTR